MLKERILAAPDTQSLQDNYPEILAWVEAWQPVRREVMELIDAYVRQNSRSDMHLFEFMIEEIDTSLRLLRHRVDWLQNKLEQSN